MEIATVLFAQKKFSKEILNFEICYRCDLLVIQGVIVLVISNRCRSSLLAIDRPILKCPARLLPELYSSCIQPVILKNIATINISFSLVCRGRFNLWQIVSIAEQINLNRISVAFAQCSLPSVILASLCSSLAKKKVILCRNQQ